MKVRAERPVKVNGVWHKIGDVFEMPDEIYSQASLAVQVIGNVKKAPAKPKKQPAEKQDNTGSQDINEVIQITDDSNCDDGKEPDEDGEEDDDA